MIFVIGFKAKRNNKKKVFLIKYNSQILFTNYQTQQLRDYALNIQLNINLLHFRLYKSVSRVNVCFDMSILFELNVKNQIQERIQDIQIMYYSKLLSVQKPLVTIFISVNKAVYAFNRLRHRVTNIVQYNLKLIYQQL